MGKYIIALSHRLLSIFDMCYAFFLFWPANVIPVYQLTTLLQFFIPLKMLFRSCCMGLKHYTKHVAAGFIILVAVTLSMLDIAQIQNHEQKENYILYSSIFILCSFFDVVSHAFKESIVRTRPVNQEQFNFRISFAQFIVGIVISPLILNFSRNYEDYRPVHFDPHTEALGDFMKWYFLKGFNCIFEVNIDNGESARCHYSSVFMIGYVLSLFVLQITLTYLMQMKKARNLRMIFALMVPITIFAFLMGGLTNSSIIPIDGIDTYNFVSTTFFNV